MKYIIKAQGDTYNKKEQLKELEYKWSSKFTLGNKEWVKVVPNAQIAIMSVRKLKELELDVIVKGLREEEHIIVNNLREIKSNKQLHTEFKEVLEEVYKSEN